MSANATLAIEASGWRFRGGAPVHRLPAGIFDFVLGQVGAGAEGCDRLPFAAHGKGGGRCRP
jgi:hypothetical protein